MTQNIQLKIREILFKVLYPIILVMGKIKAPFIKDAMALSETPTILDTLQPLDIILATTLGHLSNVEI